MPLRTAAAAIIALLLAVIGSGQNGNSSADFDDKSEMPEAEFQIARLMYATNARAGSRGISQPIWAVDYPLADEHFFDALTRLTKIQTATDSRHLDATDDRIFEYPFLWMQQPGRGLWTPTNAEAKHLREYLDRGGFLIVDDFHGEYEWSVFQSGMEKVYPERSLVDIPDDEPLLHTFFDLDRRLPVPGHRHLVFNSEGSTGVSMDGPPTWRGIYDDHNRLTVVALLNMDMGDAWEHADDPTYPAPMTIDAYRLGVNIVLYSMTH